MLARVAVSQRDQYRLIAESGELDAEPRGAPLVRRRRHRAAMPVVGDWVAARIVAPEQAIVEAVLPRRTLFSRRAPGRREDQQPIAANIDLVFLVCGLDGDFNLRRLERYLTLAAESGAAPVVVLNKTDLCADVDSSNRRNRPRGQRRAGRPAAAPPPRRLDALAAFLAPGRTVALLGSSGVGKSTIVNRILGRRAPAHRGASANRTAAAGTPPRIASSFRCPRAGR